MRASAVAVRDGSQAIVPGDAKKSELIRRVASDDADERMPPPSTGKRLTAAEVDFLSRWIRQGAPYSPHWAYVKPVRAAVPIVSDAAWPKNDIDRFLLARLQQEKLRPSPEADRYVLVRRLTLDLTGLPPTLAEVDSFVNDKSPDAYERLVDRLMARQAFGEHWARMWLDLARYADSAGYVSDVPRTIWAYRDYVIRSFNANKPFDQFTIEQIAGDLLPNPSEEQLIATAFHRNTQTNNEGGSDREEYRNVAIVDRVNTTMSVWMGTTMACAQCHDHKYDPITQKEYFRLFAIFNNTEDADREDERPVLSFYTERQKRQREKLQKEIAALVPQVPKDERTPARQAAGRRRRRGSREQGAGEQDPNPLLPAPCSAASQRARQAVRGTEGRARRDRPGHRADPAGVAAGQAPQDVYRVSRQLPRPRAGSDAKACPPRFIRFPKDVPVNRLALAKWLVDARQSAHGPGAGQPAVGEDLRHRAGRHERGFRHARRIALAPGAVGLPGDGAGRLRAGT